MKRLKQTLAVVLAVVMLIGVIPFSVNAQDADAVFAISKVNGEDYTGAEYIRSGDDIDVSLTLKAGESESIVAYLLGYGFDQAALTNTAVTFKEGWMTLPGYTGGEEFNLIGAVYLGADATESEFVAATLSFKVSSDFTGETAFNVNLGEDNYFSIDGTPVQTKDVTAEGFSFTVYEKTDKTALKAQLDAAAELDEDDYTPNSWSVFSPVLTASQGVYDNAIATQQQINDAATNLEQAIAALVPVANKRALLKAINNAKIEALKTEEYTAQCITDLQAVIAAAEIVRDDDNATQDEVDNQVSILNNFVFERNKIVVTFKNWDGSVFEEVEVTYGESATAPETNPTKPEDETFSYTFDHWEGDYSNVTASVSITPVFTSTKRDYQVVFLDDDDSVLDTQTYNYGDTVTPPANPTKEKDSIYTYEFANWDHEIETVKGDTTYKAVYNKIYNEYEIVFKNWDGTTLKSEKLHWGAEVTAPEATPVRTQDDTYTYTFSGWDTEITSVAGDKTYTAQFTPVYREYEIVFQNWDGTTLKSEKLHWGDEVTAPEETPVKEADSENTYEFKGWNQEITAVAGDTTYVAVFNNNPIEYTVEFQNWDGTTLKSEKLHWGDTVTAPEETPVKAEDDTYTYTFSGWDPEVDVVSGHVVYTAQFTPVYKEYKIEFVNWDDSSLSIQILHWGDEVTVPANPTKTADAQYTYIFTGWDKEVTAVAGPVVYKAQFSPSINSYTVYFLNDDATVFAEVSYNYGDTPVAPEGTPVKESDSTYYYTFSGWTPEFTMVTGVSTYTATFEPAYLDADYSAVETAFEAANALNGDDYTEVSYARLFIALGSVEYGLKINEQEKVDGFATAINEAIAKLVNDNEYKVEYAKCAAVNNNDNRYKVESYNAFVAAFAAIGAQQDFNTEQATQEDVNAAVQALKDAYALLQAAELQINGAKESISEDDILTASNTTILDTKLEAYDGGAGTAQLKFYDAQGNAFDSTVLRIGTGFKVDLVQNDEVKISKNIVVYGDINGDGLVSITDIVLVKKMALSTDGFSEYQILAAKCGGADIDVDKVIELALAL